MGLIDNEDFVEHKCVIKSVPNQSEAARNTNEIDHGHLLTMRPRCLIVCQAG